MFHIAKYVFYVLVIGVVVFLVWFLPKYSYVQKNPGYCAALTKNFYYCGNESNINEVFDSAQENKKQIEDAKETYDEVNSSLNP
jgi:hypothetical protein